MTPTSPRGSEPEPRERLTTLRRRRAPDTGEQYYEAVDVTDQYVAVDALLTDEAVERAARAMCANGEQAGRPFRFVLAETQERYRSDARVALEAVLGVGHE